MPAVILQLFQGLADIREGEMGFLFLDGGEGRIPARGQFLERADVDEAVMEEAIQGGHEAADEAAILPNRIAA